MKKVVLSWSSGKDAAWSLLELKRMADVQVVALLTTFNTQADRVAMHAVRRSLVRAQALCAGLPLWEIELPAPCSNEDYEARMEEATERATAEGITHVAFGDLYLEDVRKYREERLVGTGLSPLFPLWGQDTRRLAETMVDSGVVAHLTSVDPKQLGPEFVGRRFDHALLGELPAGVDPCGERGEFHSFVSAGPMFSVPIDVTVGERLEKDGFWYADVVPN